MPTRDADESEARTRRLRIDKRLRDAGWKVAPFDPAQAPSAHTNHAVEEYPTANGPVDYALLAEGKLLGIVEGKRRATGAQNVLSQAKRYAQGLRPSPPFLHSSNGETIWHRDARHEMNLSRPLPHFHRPDALLEMTQRDFEAETAWFAANENWHECLRPYQIDANRAIERAIAERKRQMLVAMATGTGARRAEALFKLADAIEARVASATARVDRLTQAILAKAFRDEMIPQDPRDEPASQLLKRIRRKPSTTPAGESPIKQTRPPRLHGATSTGEAN